MWLNSAVGRLRSLDLNQCVGCLGIFLSKELNQGSWDFKSLYLPTKEIRGSKGVWATFKKLKENYTWKLVKNPGNIMEFCYYGKVGTLCKCKLSVWKKRPRIKWQIVFYAHRGWVRSPSKSWRLKMRVLKHLLSIIFYVISHVLLWDNFDQLSDSQCTIILCHLSHSLP